MISAFPVLSEQRLGPPIRRMLRGEQRPVASLPEAGPGTVLAFEVDGRYHVHESRARLTGLEPEVLQAVSVSVIDLRRRVVPVSLELPSTNASTPFEVTAEFAFQVVDVEPVAAAGLHEDDLRRTVAYQLRADAKLMGLTSHRHIDDLANVRDQVVARIRAICGVRPPIIAGMSVSLCDVTVESPRAHLDHEARMLGQSWREKEAYLARRAEEAEVEWVAAMDPERLQALGVTRGQVNLSDAAERSFENRAQTQEVLLRHVQNLHPNGELAYADPEIRQLVYQLTNVLIGPQAREALGWGGARPGATDDAVGAIPRNREKEEKNRALLEALDDEDNDEEV